jgi:HAD superfamily hydrolase (TIGR01509 family)
MIELVIFDMDGVLVDSEAAITYASMEALSEVGVEADYEDFKPYTGMGDDKFIGSVANKYGKEYDVKMKERAYQIYIEKKDRVKVFKSSKKLIESVTGQGLKCAVASASDFVKVQTNLSCIGVDISVFTAIITGSDVKNKKPDPEIFLKTADSCKISPEYTIVVEDAISGVQAAKSAGMICIAVTTSFDRATLLSAGADYVIDELYEAFDILENFKNFRR